MIAPSPDSQFSLEMRAQFITILEEAGCQQVSVRHDGQRLVLEGNAKSFECKVRAMRLLSPMSPFPILNCIRVYPA